MSSKDDFPFLLYSPLDNIKKQQEVKVLDHHEDNRINGHISTHDEVVELFPFLINIESSQTIILHRHVHCLGPPQDRGSVFINSGFPFGPPPLISVGEMWPLESVAQVDRPPPRVTIHIIITAAAAKGPRANFSFTIWQMRRRQTIGMEWTRNVQVATPLVQD